MLARPQLDATPWQTENEDVDCSFARLRSAFAFAAKHARKSLYALPSILPRPHAFVLASRRSGATPRPQRPPQHVRTRVNYWTVGGFWPEPRRSQTRQAR